MNLISLYSRAFMVFLVLALPIFLYADHTIDSITGMASDEPEEKEEKLPEPDGEYSITPNFALGFSYDLEIYKELRTKVRKLVKDVQECEGSWSQCIDKNIPDGWSRQCGTEEEQVFADVVEKIRLCSRSEDDFCVCEIPFDPSLGEGEFQIDMERYDSGTEFVMGDMGYMLDSVHIAADLDDDGLFRDSTVGGSELAIGFSYSDGDDKEALEYARFLQDRRLQDFGYDLLLYKKGADLMAVSALDYHKAMQKAESEPNIFYRACQLPKKTTYKFCVDTGERIEAYADGEVSEERLVHRFALDLADAKAPEQPELIVQDNPGAKGSLLLDWESTAPDIDHYDVYVKKSPIEDLHDIRPTVITEDTSLVLRELVSHDRIFPIEDAEIYYVAVVPVDRSNNMVTENIVSIAGVSVDDREANGGSL